jgi:hypothetical protein
MQQVPDDDPFTIAQHWSDWDTWESKIHPNPRQPLLHRVRIRPPKVAPRFRWRVVVPFLFFFGAYWLALWPNISWLGIIVFLCWVWMYV